MENQRKPINENTFVEFFKGLDESYQRFVIDKMQKKPPDSAGKAKKADSAGLDGGPVSR